MHRCHSEKRLNFIKDMHACGLYASISVVVKEGKYSSFIEKLAENRLVPEYITIDVAHSHADSVIRMIHYIKSHFRMIHYIKSHLPNSFVITGNVGTPEAVWELEHAGANATKVGIGPGKVCITKIKTGFGTGGWQLSALRWCSKAASNPIIADGDIPTHRDIVKSIRFGASMVMIGSLFAGHEKSPGKVIEKDGKIYTEYFGSASEFQKGEKRNVEREKMYIAYRGPLKETLDEMKQDLQSSISYACKKIGCDPQYGLCYCQKFNLQRRYEI